MAKAQGVSPATVQRISETLTPQAPRNDNAVRRAEQKHPRFHLHFTPTSSSWLNLVKRWFRELTDKAVRRGVFHSVPDLTTAIEEYLNAHNNNPKPFVWTASIDSILEKSDAVKPF
jgi:hypothetical protein